VALRGVRVCKQFSWLQAGSVKVAGSSSSAHKAGMSRVYLYQDEENHFDRGDEYKYRES
jgi:hypothetical protein